MANSDRYRCPPCCASVLSRPSTSELTRGDAVRALAYRRAGAQRSSIAALDASRVLDEPDRGGAAASQFATLESRLKGGADGAYLSP
jgi:hypothetical protein